VIRSATGSWFAPWRGWPKSDARSAAADGLAGLVGAIIVLPQAIAFATLAGLPPEYGLYAAMVPALVAAWFGSSWHAVSGPNNAVSLMVFATLSPLFMPGSAAYINAALTLALLSGLIILAAGLLRLGGATNFISPEVTATFSAGVGILIILSQLPVALGLPSVPDSSLPGTLNYLGRRWREAELLPSAVAAFTLAAGLLSLRYLPRVPPLLLALVVGTAFALALDPEGAKLRLLGSIPAALPPLSLPVFSAEEFQKLSSLAVAVASLSIIQSIAAARAVARRSGQRLDANRQLVAEGLSNVAGSFFSSYPGCNSFNRTMANYEAGARTPLAALAAALLLPLLVFFVAPLLASLPYAMMAGLLILVGVRLIDVAELRTLARAGRAEATVVSITLAATLMLSLELAIFLGVALSLGLYLHRSAHPRFAPIVPNPASPTRKAREIAPGEAECPQFKLVRIDGGLYFGSAEHAEDGFEKLRREHPGQKHLMIACKGISYLDLSGARVIGEEAVRRRREGGDLYLHALRAPIRQVLAAGGQLDAIGPRNVFESKHDALASIVPRLDGEICARCSARIFIECAKQPGGELAAEAPQAMALASEFRRP
jgi:SulP family sulfate permease